MKMLVALAALVALAGCSPAEPELGALRPPIVNGTRDPRAVELTDSQILAIGWLHSSSDPSRPFCTGTLVTPNVVATAAHCVRGVGAGEVGFGLGVDPASPGALFDSIAVVASRELDAALIVLSEDATAGGLEVTPIPINRTPVPASLVGQAAQAGGYGDTYDPTTSGRWFATVYVAEVNPTEIVVDGRGEQGICFGDSGSGLISLDSGGEPVVLAVESWGDPSCVDVDHMTRLDVLWDWIAPILDGEIPPDPCEGMPPEGRCVDNVAESCRRSTFREMDCTPLGLECAWIEDSDRYGCACGPLAEAEWCDGAILEYCRDGRFFQRNCGLWGGTCGWTGPVDGYECVESAPCRPEDAAGRCEAGVAVNCTAGRTTREVCFVDGRECVETDAGALCVEPGADGDADVDGDVDGDADGDGDADMDGDADADAAPDAAPDADAGGDDEGGCSCRAAARRDAAASLPALALFGIVTFGLSRGRRGCAE